jgi:two-component system, CitB family, response regulator
MTLPVSVLIVEDDARIADLHRRFVAQVEGFETVGIAHSIDDAQNFLEALAPDLVLLDLYFPKGDGLSLLRAIRARGLETDVILITAAREAGPLKEALRGGVFDYIIKPVIVARFTECLEKFRLYRERLGDGKAIEQRDVDRLLRPAPSKAVAGQQAEDLPKGIDALTLAKVRAVFQKREDAEGFSAESVGGLIGVSRTTARRYLEYLVSVGAVYADVVYGAVGRPERKYFRITRPPR